MSSPAVQATVQSVEEQDSITWCLPMSAQCVETEGPKPTPIPLDELRLAQKEDQHIGPVITYLQSCTKPMGQQLKSLSMQTRRLLREREKLTLDGDGILRRKTTNKIQLILPGKYKDMVLTALHDEMGHQGLDRTASLVRERFFWPNMYKDIEN